MNQFYNYHYTLEANEDTRFYQAAVKRCKDENKPVKKKTTVYQNVRLPENDSVMLSNYMRIALKFEFDHDKHKIDYLKLLRLKINHEMPIYEVPRPINRVRSQFGCWLRHSFYLKGFTKPHLCKVYRRIRWLNEDLNIKYKDWKIKVLQETEPKSWDYLILHKLPTRLRNIEKFLHNHLEVVMENMVCPEPIGYIKLDIPNNEGCKVYSQMYFDQFQSKRFDLKFKDKKYFSQQYDQNKKVGYKLNEREIVE